MLSMQHQVTGLLGPHSLAVSHPRFVPKRKQRSPTSSRVTTICSATSRTSWAPGPFSPLAPETDQVYSPHITHTTRRTQNRGTPSASSPTGGTSNMRGSNGRAHVMKAKNTTPSAHTPALYLGRRRGMCGRLWFCGRRTVRERKQGR